MSTLSTPAAVRNDFADWVDAQTDVLYAACRAGCEQPVDTTAVSWNLWLIGQIETIAKNARALGAQYPGQYDEREAAMDAARDADIRREATMDDWIERVETAIARDPSITETHAA